MAIRTKAFIFDNDGLLQDTEPHYEKAYQRLASAYNLLELPPDLLLRFKGLDLREVYKLFVGRVDLPIGSFDQFKKELNEYLAELAPSAEMMAGAKDLVCYLNGLEIPIAVATSSLREIFELKIRNHHGLYAKFDCKVCGDDPQVKRGKPEPDLLLTCAKRMGFARNECIYVGDQPVDVKAALNAGMLPVVIPARGRDLSDFTSIGPVVIVPSLHCLGRFIIGPGF